MITWGHLGSFIALSLAIKQVIGERDVHLNSEKTNFGILEMKVDGNWVTGKFSNTMKCHKRSQEFIQGRKVTIITKKSI